MSMLWWLWKENEILIAVLLCIRQESCDDAEQWQEGTHLEDELNTGLVGQPAEESGAQTSQAKHQSEEDASYQSHFVGCKNTLILADHTLYFDYSPLLFDICPIFCFLYYVFPFFCFAV